jgi:peroxiredoxin
MQLLNPHEMLDIGFMAEDFYAHDLNENELNIKRYGKDTMQIFFAFSDANKQTLDEVRRIDALFNEAVVAIRCYCIFSQSNEALQTLSSTLQKCQILVDFEEDFALNYGVKIVDGGLAKSLFLVGKDGAVYHVQTPQSADEAFDLELLRLHLNKTYTTYNGEGCHG